MYKDFRFMFEEEVSSPESRCFPGGPTAMSSPDVKLPQLTARFVAVRTA